MNKLFGNKSGFTLIELMIAVLLSGVVITLVYQIISVTTKTNSVVAEQTAAMSAIDSTVETVRKSIMVANTMTIGDAQIEPVPAGASVIKCVDDAIYFDDHEIGSARNFAVSHIDLKFSAQESGKVLRMELGCYDENNGILDGKSRVVDLYLQSLGENGEGKIKNSSEGSYKNCIVFTSMDRAD